MSIKTFCDHCNFEITENNIVTPGGLIGKIKKVGLPTLYIQVLIDDASDTNKGDFCKNCVIDAVKSLDDRPTIIAKEHQQ